MANILTCSHCTRWQHWWLHNDKNHELHAPVHFLPQECTASDVNHFRCDSQCPLIFSQSSSAIPFNPYPHYSLISWCQKHICLWGHCSTGVKHYTGANISDLPLCPKLCYFIDEYACLRPDIHDMFWKIGKKLVHQWAHCSTALHSRTASQL